MIHSFMTLSSHVRRLNRWNSSSMRKWLRDNNLEGGDGNPAIEISPSNAADVLRSFRNRLSAAGVTLCEETSNRLGGIAGSRQII
jgi:hypothetical protein